MYRDFVLIVVDSVSVYVCDLTYLSFQSDIPNGSRIVEEEDDLVAEVDEDGRPVDKAPKKGKGMHADMFTSFVVLMNARSYSLRNTSSTKRRQLFV